MAGTSVSAGEGPVPPASGFGAQPGEDAGLGSFRAGGPLREAPPPALLPQVQGTACCRCPVPPPLLCRS
jgi:hypothetical protein